MRILLERGMVFITVVVYDLVFESRFCKHNLCKRMLKLSPNMDQNRHKFDLKSTKSCTMGLMCSQGAPKSHRDMDFCRHNGSRVTPQGSNSSPLAAKRHPKGFTLSPTRPPEAHFDTQRAPFGHLVGTIGPPRLDFVIVWIS